MNPPKLMEDSPIGPINERETITTGITHYVSMGICAYWLSPERQAQLPAWVKEPDGTIVNTHRDPAWWEGPEKNIILLAFETEFCKVYAEDGPYEGQSWGDIVAVARYRLSKSHPTLYARYERSKL